MAETDDVVQGCWKWLSAQKYCPPLHDPPRGFHDTHFQDDLFNSDPPIGHFPGPKPYTYFFFQDDPGFTLEGTGSAMVILSDAGTWGGPGETTTWEFPRIALNIWVDPERRNTPGNMPWTLPPSNATPATPAMRPSASMMDTGETRLRLKEIYKRFNKYLHVPFGRTQWWGTVRVVECHRIGGLNIYDIPDGGGLLRGEVFYGVSCG